jgi:putative methyltransferase (TIGR04325 family)
MFASNPTTTTVKAVVKRLCPPLLLDLARGRPLFSKPLATWEGIYAQLREVPTENASYDYSSRIEEFVTHTGSALTLLKAGKAQHPGWHEPLGLLAASITRGRDQLHVLDFGGGVGLAYVQLLSALRSDVVVRHDVVDLENMCQAGRRLFADDPRIQFHTSLPALAGQLDIVYASSVFPYVDDYAALVRALVGLGASYILFTQLAAGEFPTYAARQLNLSGQVLPYWFLNIHELISLVAAGGYSWVYSAEAGPQYDQRAYPPTHRLGRMKTVLFVREPSTDSKLRGGEV